MTTRQRSPEVTRLGVVCLAYLLTFVAGVSAGGMFAAWQGHALSIPEQAYTPSDGAWFLLLVLKSNGRLWLYICTGLVSFGVVGLFVLLGNAVRLGMDLMSMARGASGELVYLLPHAALEFAAFTLAAASCQDLAWCLFDVLVLNRPRVPARAGMQVLGWSLVLLVMAACVETYSRIRAVRPMTNETGIGGEGLLVRDLERRYPKFQLGPVSFRLPPGRALGLLGSNGAGKTTLLAGVAGQARLQRGDVAWNGQPIRRGEWRYKHVVSYVRDVPAFYGELTVEQTLAFVSRLHPTWKRRRAADLLERFALDPGKRLQALSRGMRAKLGLLLATCHDVRLLLLDEVTAGVDADTRNDIQRFLRTLVAEGVAVLVSSHIFEDIEQVSDDVLILRRGMPVFSGALSAMHHLTVAVLPVPAPPVVARAASVVGNWNDAGETTLLMSAPIEAPVEEALQASGAVRRAATVRDLYFAYRERV